MRTAQSKTLRPRSRAVHYAALLTPGAMAAGRVVLERGNAERAQRIRAATSRVLRTPRSAGDSRMRGLVASPGGRLRWRRVPAPGPPHALGAVVRPIAVATCDLDRAMMLGRSPFPLPIHLGHECVAEVLEVGAEVQTVRVGEQVVVPFQINCGTCAPCLNGHTGNCSTVPPASMYGFGLTGGLWGGALADRLSVPYADAMLVPLPAGIDPVAAASVADNISDAYRQVAPYLPSLLATDSEAEVLVVGPLNRNSPVTSSSPLYAGLIAQALGARNLTVVDARPAVLRLADSLGMRTLRAGDHRGWPVAPLTVDATGSPAGLRRVLGHTAPDGMCTCVWSLHRRGGLPMVQSYARNVTLHIGRSHARTVIPEVLALMADGRLRPQDVITEVAAFDDAPAALYRMRGPDAVKTILVNSA